MTIATYLLLVEGATRKSSEKSAQNSTEREGLTLI